LVPTYRRLPIYFVGVYIKHFLLYMLLSEHHSPTCRWRLSSRPTWRKSRLRSGCRDPRSPPPASRTGRRRPRNALRTWRTATRSRPSSRRPSGPCRPAVRCTRGVPRPQRGHRLWPRKGWRWPLQRPSTGGGTTAAVAAKRTAVVSWQTCRQKYNKCYVYNIIRLGTVSAVRLTCDKR